MSIFIVYTKEKGKIETDKRDDFVDLTWHRTDGPAIQEFWDAGHLQYEAYYSNDKRHRLDGPAFQTFNDNGKLNFETYYINGKCYTKSGYDAEIFKMKLALL